MLLKALRLHTAFLSSPHTPRLGGVAPACSPARAALAAPPRRLRHDGPRPGADKTPTRPQGPASAAPVPPPKPPRNRRAKRQAGDDAVGSQAMKILTGITALLGAWHAVPAVHKHHRKQNDQRRTEMLVIEVPEAAVTAADAEHQQD